MSIIKTVIAKAKELLDAVPDGIRYAKLHTALQAALPKVNANTITNSLNRLRTTEPAYNPEKGLYRSPKFTNADEVLPPASNTTPKQAKQKEEAFYKPFGEWLTSELQEASKAIPLGGNKFQDRWGTPDVIGVLRAKPTDIFTFPPEILSAEINPDYSRRQWC